MAAADEGEDCREGGSGEQKRLLVVACHVEWLLGKGREELECLRRHWNNKSECVCVNKEHT